jgi:putative restriction endonuclease
MDSAELSDLALRESAFAWLRTQLLTAEGLTRDELAQFPFQGRTYRLTGTQTGIWRIREWSDAAISILTAYSPDETRRPYDDDVVGVDGLLRYKWRGTDPNQADNVWLRRAMERQVPLIWFIGIGYAPGSKTQLFRPEFPVYLVAEEPDQQQFVVMVDGQAVAPHSSDAEVIDITRRYNERITKVRVHQPLFRSAVLIAYERRCAICRLPFAELLDAAHIKSDADGGAARVSNGLALCKIHHGAFDSNLIGISPDYVVHVRESVLRTVDGPTLQHAIKETEGQRLGQLPRSQSERPDRDLLAERFERFENAS